MQILLAWDHEIRATVNLGLKYFQKEKDTLRKEVYLLYSVTHSKSLKPSLVHLPQNLEQMSHQSQEQRENECTQASFSLLLGNSGLNIGNGTTLGVKVSRVYLRPCLKIIDVLSFQMCDYLLFTANRELSPPMIFSF